MRLGNPSFAGLKRSLLFILPSEEDTAHRLYREKKREHCAVRSHRLGRGRKTKIWNTFLVSAGCDFVTEAGFSFPQIQKKPV